MKGSVCMRARYYCAAAMFSYLMIFVFLSISLFLISMEIEPVPDSSNILHYMPLFSFGCFIIFAILYLRKKIDGIKETTAE